MQSWIHVMLLGSLKITVEDEGMEHASFQLFVIYRDFHKANKKRSI